MPRKLRKRKATDSRLEDDAEQLPDQKTLTQIGWIPSPYTDFEFDEPSRDPEFAGKPTSSKPGKKRRKKIQKETLTQMDFLSPVLGDGNTNYDQENVVIPSMLANSRRKQPRAVKEDPLAREVYTRSVRRRAAEKVSAAVADSTVRAEPPRAKASGGQYHNISGPAMLPPRTPCVLRSRVIPSSQTPPETPLSTQSTKSSGTQTRSPLKERSVNVRTANTPTVNRLLFPGKLDVAEIADTEDSQTPTAIATSTNVSQIYLPPAIRISAGPGQNDLKDQVRLHSSVISDVGGHSVVSRDTKREILDSEDEEMENEISEDEPGARADTQAAYNENSSSSPSRLKEAQSVPKTVSKPWDVGEQSEREAIIGRFNGDHRLDVAIGPSIPAFEAAISRLLTPNRHPSATKLSIQGDVHALANLKPIASPTRDSQNPNSRAAGELSIPDFDALTSQNCTLIEPSSTRCGASTTAKHPVSQRSDTEILLAADSVHDRESPPTRLGPETESQFENAWRSLSPPPHLSPFSSSPNHASPNDPSTPILANLFEAAPLPYHTAPIPPSQATTVDITQRTQPQAALPRGFPGGIIDLSSERDGKQQRSSSPPLPPSLPPLTSSPVNTRKTQGEDAWMGYGGEWNHRRLTDSQLLPDSLMNDSFAGPPGWETQGSDGLEYE